DGGRWTELFELNQGATSADGVHAFVDPNTIWPGLRLQLPDTSDDAANSATDVSDALPEAEPNELLVASAAPLPAADPAPEAHSNRDPAQATPPPADQSDLMPPPPLLRTPHALQPVILDPADAPPDASSTQAAGSSSRVGAEDSVPTTPGTT